MSTLVSSPTISSSIRGNSLVTIAICRSLISRVIPKSSWGPDYTTRRAQGPTWRKSMIFWLPQASSMLSRLVWKKNRWMISMKRPRQRAYHKRSLRSSNKSFSILCNPSRSKSNKVFIRISWKSWKRINQLNISSQTSREHFSLQRSAPTIIAKKLDSTELSNHSRISKEALSKSLWIRSSISSAWSIFSFQHSIQFQLPESLQEICFTWQSRQLIQEKGA